jgi:hypothetical protein
MSTIQPGNKSLQNGDDHATDQDLAKLSLSSQTIHADDYLNAGQDVAPALHVSTTFRYNSNPEALVPLTERDVHPPLPVREII